MKGCAARNIIKKLKAFEEILIGDLPKAGKHFLGTDTITHLTCQEQLANGTVFWLPK